MVRKIQFITQAKGGSGKSVLTFMLAEKYHDAILLDLDDATTTTMKQLAYRNPIHISFLDPLTKRIDRVPLTDFLKVWLKQTANYI
jgi:cellulose biosynthesis protein BcsQ